MVCGHLNIIRVMRSRALEQVLEERVGLGQPSGKGWPHGGCGVQGNEEGGRAPLVRISGSGSRAGRRERVGESKGHEGPAMLPEVQG